MTSVITFIEGEKDYIKTCKGKNGRKQVKRIIAPLFFQNLFQELGTPEETASGRFKTIWR